MTGEDGEEDKGGRRGEEKLINCAGNPVCNASPLRSISEEKSHFQQDIKTETTSAFFSVH